MLEKNVFVYGRLAYNCIFLYLVTPFQPNEGRLSSNAFCQVFSGSYKGVGGNEWNNLVVSHI